MPVPRVRKGAGLSKGQRRRLETDVFEDEEAEQIRQGRLDDGIGTAEPDGLPEGFEDEEIASDDDDDDDVLSSFGRFGTVDTSVALYLRNPQSKVPWDGDGGPVS